MRSIVVRLDITAWWMSNEHNNVYIYSNTIFPHQLLIRITSELIGYAVIVVYEWSKSRESFMLVCQSSVKCKVYIYTSCLDVRVGCVGAFTYCYHINIFNQRQTCIDLSSLIYSYCSTNSGGNRSTTYALISHCPSVIQDQKSVKQQNWITVTSVSSTKEDCFNVTRLTFVKATGWPPFGC